MQTLRIGQLENYYRMPRRALEQRGRLESISHMVLDEMLEHALDRVGIPPLAEICIRELHIPVRLSLAKPDRELALAWCMALAVAVRQAVDVAATDRVVYYGSRAHALIDLTVGVARGDVRRSWAWQQMGLVSAALLQADVLQAWQRALLNHPETIIPVLRAAAREGVFGQLVLRLEPDVWPDLAEAAVTASGGDAQRIRKAASRATDRVRTADQASLFASNQSLAMFCDGLRRSPLAQAIIADAGQLLRTSGSCGAFAVLVCLDAEPAMLRWREDDVCEYVQTATELLLELAHRGTESLPDDAAGARSAKTRVAATARTTGEEAAGPRSPDSDAAYQASSTLYSDGKDRSQAMLPNGECPRAETTDASPIPSVRTRAFTDFGGLLFLVHALEDLEFPQQIPRNERLAARPFRWLLHRLALRLIPAAEDDPAALAFAGLAPDAPLPSRDVPPPSVEEQREVSLWVDRIGEWLWNQIERRDCSAAVLIDWICSRRAEVVADPGWIEVHFSLEDVATEIRRSGIDLDPGFVPWLGVVLRFVYGQRPC